MMIIIFKTESSKAIKEKDENVIFITIDNLSLKEYSRSEAFAYVYWMIAAKNFFGFGKSLISFVIQLQN